VAGPVIPTFYRDSREGEPVIISAGFTMKSGCGQGQYAGGGRLGKNGSLEYDIGVPTFMNTATRQFGTARGARQDDAERVDPGCGTHPVSVSIVAERFTLGADALFAFDKSAMKDVLPGGRDALDKFAAQLMSVYRKVISITVTGHTDRLGTDSYNQALSLARATTIRDHLVMRGLPVQVMSVVGAGKSHPVTRDCPDGRNAEVIRCLQPDRRVSIDVIGEKRERIELDATASQSFEPRTPKRLDPASGELH
jgi:outer membrane protein OmpA-like peptidoglycan-associated protein